MCGGKVGGYCCILCLSKQKGLVVHVAVYICSLYSLLPCTLFLLSRCFSDNSLHCVYRAIPQVYVHVTVQNHDIVEHTTLRINKT